MPNQKDLSDLIKLLRNGTPKELGKAWRERYKNIYSKPNPEVAEIDAWIHSDKSALPDLDNPNLIFDGKI